LLPAVTQTMMMTATYIVTPSSQPWANPSFQIPTTNDTKAARRRIQSI